MTIVDIRLCDVLSQKAFLKNHFTMFLDMLCYDLCVIECLFQSLPRYANEHGLPVLNNVCLPRLVATKTIIDELTPKEGSYHVDLEDSQSLASFY